MIPLTPNDWKRCHCGHDEMSSHVVIWNRRSYCLQCTENNAQQLEIEYQQKQQDGLTPCLA